MCLTSLFKQLLHEFGIKHNRYIFCRVARVGKIAILYLANLVQEGMISYPELANQPFRRSHFHRSENAFSKP